MLTQDASLTLGVYVHAGRPGLSRRIPTHTSSSMRTHMHFFFLASEIHARLHLLAHVQVRCVKKNPTLFLNLVNTEKVDRR